METDTQTIFHVYKFQDNEIHCPQLAWSMNQLDYNIHGYSIILYIFESNKPML